MAQMKEENKTSEIELNKMEISNISDAEFQTLVIRTLKELTEYSNKVKKTQEEMKVTLSEIKKNLQGTNMEERKNQINDLEHKEEKSIQTNSKNKKKKLKTKQNTKIG